MDIKIWDTEELEYFEDIGLVKEIVKSVCSRLSEKLHVTIIPYIFCDWAGSGRRELWVRIYDIDPIKFDEYNMGYDEFDPNYITVI